MTEQEQRSFESLLELLRMIATQWKTEPREQVSTLRVGLVIDTCADMLERYLHSETPD